MIDFTTYRKLHPETTRRKKLGRYFVGQGSSEDEPEEVDEEIIKREDPPGTRIINLFPSVIVGFNLRLKKWGTGSFRIRP